jgi:uncharacterized protein (DUF1501 family)
MEIRISRRGFLKIAAVFSTLGVAPQFLTRAAEGEAPPIAGFKDDRVLVVVQLSGGNDGLNTVVPYADDLYYRARPRVGLKRNRVLPLNDHVGLNDRLVDLIRLHDDGQLAVIQGVGYPNPDRSHFRSMEIWHTASGSDEFLSTGWIGRYFDNTCSGSARPQAGVAIGKERPQAFDGEKGFGVAFERPDLYGWRNGGAKENEARFQRLNRPGPCGNETLDFLRHTTSNAILSAREVQEACSRADVKQARGRGADPLAVVAGLIRGGLQTRIYYVSFGGFDTHANQVGQHDNLLARCGAALANFQKTLRRDGTADRVLTMVFSEFGRRVEENASGGTDHGTAAPMFLVGSGVKAGVHGSPPSLTDLQDGDLKHGVDFRSVYATVLERWFETPSEAILGEAHPTLSLLA